MTDVHLLLVEDEAAAAREIARLLEQQGWSVEVCADGDAGLRRAAETSFDVIIVDRVMPRLDGVSMLARLRALGVTTPAIMLSAYRETDHRVSGLDAGADDYLGKPFEGAELVARVRAQLRRSVASERIRVVGEIAIFQDSASARRGDRPLGLTPAEFRLLHLLAETAPDPVTPRMILERVMNWRAAEPPTAPVVPVAIRRLRAKVDDGEAVKLIETIKHVGYRLRT